VITHVGQDLRFAARGLSKRRGLTAVALLTLAVGLGANTAMFSVVNTVLLGPLPFRDPDRLVMVWASNPTLARDLGFPDKLPTSPAAFYDWKSQSRSFSSMAMIRPNNVNLSGDGDPERLGAVVVTGQFFQALGSRAAVGRTLLPEDDGPAAPAAVVLSQAFWQRRFGGDASAVGRTIKLDSKPTVVVGVMPRSFAFPRAAEMPAGFGFAREPDIWIPAALSPEGRRERGMRGALALGRLADGVSVPQAQAELQAITARLWELYPDSDRGWGVRVDPLPAQLTGDVRPALLLLLGAVGLVLLIACGNVACLLLAQAISRRKEIAIRIALGARRRRLVGQLLTESTLLSLLGGGLGLLCAHWTLRVLVRLVPASVPGADRIALDWQVGLFTLIASVLTGVVFGLLPALLASRVALADTLKDSARTAGEAGSRKAGRMLVATEMALAVMLVVGAGLLVRSFARLSRVDTGFERDRLLTFRIDLSGSRYNGAGRRAFVAALLDRLRTLPLVRAAGATTALPMTNAENLERLEIEGRPRPAAGQEVWVDFRVASPGYFAALGMPLKRGRTFGETDGAEQPKVAVVSEALARACWPHEDPIGRRLRLYEHDSWSTVVGVVGDVRHSGMHSAPRPHFYTPYAQSPRGDLTMAVRTTADPQALVPAVRAAVAAVDLEQPIAELRTMDQVIADSLADRRFNMALLAAFAGMALLLSAVGLYGITSYSVGQRTREMGLRMALGATPRHLLRLVFAESMWTVLLGLVPGILGALAFGRLLSGLLYGIPAADPATFAGCVAVLGLAALIASLVPGLRAARVDPMISLRAE
jgi:putative ABC transport system permease protein